MRKIVLAPFLLLAACGQSQESVSYKDSEGNEKTVNVEDNGDTRSVTSQDGMISAQGSKGGQNARFPAFAPQYPGATVQTSVDMNVGGGMVKQHVITQLTPDSPEKVMAFYKEKAVASGKRLKEMGSGPGAMLVIGGTGLADMEASVTAMATAGGTSVNVATQER